jgi:hypothetical protein
MNEQYGNLPDAFYLSQEEIETLRKSKKELTEYGKEKLRKLMKDACDTSQTGTGSPHRDSFCCMMTS